MPPFARVVLIHIRSFACAAPTEWNALPSDIRLSPILAISSHVLKYTYFFLIFDFLNVYYYYPISIFGSFVHLCYVFIVDVLDDFVA